VLHLGERDCSIQRRHQKVIEEAPSPAMNPALRQAMGAAAIAAARSVAYVGAGTVEFLLAPDGRFFFLEMNTRLQVEHPVTELVTGLDLVEWQLRVAAGERLPLDQEQVALSGHAIEARLYAEDASGDFLPQAGKLLAWEPPAGERVRADHGVRSGISVSPHYDPMIAKIIAHGATRDEARRRLVAALEDTVALGLVTNRRFLLELLAHPAFAAGDTSTGFIDRHFPAAARARKQPEPRLVALAAALFAERARDAGSASLSHWRSSGPAASPLLLRSGEARIALEVTGLDGSRCRVAWGGVTHEVELLERDGARLRFLADGLAETASCTWDGPVLHLALGRLEGSFEDASLSGRTAEAAGAGAALAPMTGTIAAVRVRPGDAVRKGQCLVILEAMKMEHEILAPRDGMVASVLVAAGDQVATRKLLVELAPEAAARAAP